MVPNVMDNWKCIIEGFINQKLKKFFFTFIIQFFRIDFIIILYFCPPKSAAGKCLIIPKLPMLWLWNFNTMLWKVHFTYHNFKHIDILSTTRDIQLESLRLNFQIFENWKNLIFWNLGDWEMPITYKFGHFRTK